MVSSASVPAIRAVSRPTVTRLVIAWARPAGHRAIRGIDAHRWSRPEEACPRACARAPGLKLLVELYCTRLLEEVDHGAGIGTSAASSIPVKRSLFRLRDPVGQVTLGGRTLAAVAGRCAQDPEVGSAEVRAVDLARSAISIAFASARTAVGVPPYARRRRLVLGGLLRDAGVVAGAFRSAAHDATVAAESGSMVPHELVDRRTDPGTGIALEGRDARRRAFGVPAA